ncbi:DUF2058 domain-containing protein [Kineobactrum salinum]|uniref:DUF2058 domain-containing protein n=1 Tax=Kineobactrum salinum TaxID=2708301 RepID=A0A6C0U0Y7_9GAMM|nr:DUF2058 domain-containing protein [Kineobactrum salinum]QIB65691.1 DUF2058 domain-containing protein [Kineobactrum salinum]
MANSLQDQLLKAGLVDASTVKGVNKAKKKKARQQRGQGIEAVDETREAVLRAQREQAERDRQLNAERNRQAQDRAIVAQIRQLITSSRIPRGNGQVAYNFSDGSKIKKMFVTAAIQDQLANGRLAIVRLDDSYELVPMVVADKIRQRDESYVIVSQQPQASVDQAEDPYADYKIPDDLMW